MRKFNSLRTHIRGSFCVYCGEGANTVEHFPPASYSLGGFLLPACIECNLIASTFYPIDFLSRCEYVKSKLKKKYKKQLMSPSWDDEEISSLGRNLKKGTIVWKKQKEIATKRLAWNALSYISNIDHNNDFVLIYVEEGVSEKIKKE